MPTYQHSCCNEECKHEFEDFYSITKDPPTTCPKCGQETVKRVIADNSSRGIVELYGEDLKEKVKSDAAKLKRDMHKSEKIYSNLLGDSKMEQVQQRIDKQKRR